MKNNVDNFKGCNKLQPVAFLRYGERVPVQNVPFGAMWISDRNDPRAFPVYHLGQLSSEAEISEAMVNAYQLAKEAAEYNIQGFHQDGHHYVRDMRKPLDSQIVWEVKYITAYDAGYGAMIKAIERLVAIETISAALSVQQ